MSENNPKPKREPIPQTDVLNWLAFNHPKLSLDSEIDREWVWISTDLRGEEHKATREAIKQYGFRFAKRGHALPSGKQAFWGHCCTKPLPFRRHKKPGQPMPDTESPADEMIASAANFFGI